MKRIGKLEGLIVTELRDLKGLESELGERFARLRAVPPDSRLFSQGSDGLGEPGPRT